LRIDRGEVKVELAGMFRFESRSRRVMWAATSAQITLRVSTLPEPLLMNSKTGPLPYESLAMIAMIVSRAAKVFGSEDGAARWLRTPNPGLAGQTPLACLDTEKGSDLVFQMLGAIESGGHPSPD
jgi:hypothetical protein